MAGNLYIVSTPIGNLSDFTWRAVETLRSVAIIACEDTRQTRKLLDHYGLSTPLVSYHEHNEAERAAELAARMESGDSVALVSDAGTPLVSDPGYRIVRAAVERGIRVVPIPGASALLAALAASGLPTDSFHFGGFLPRKAGERRRMLEALAGTASTLAFYEAPHRVVESLRDIEEVLGDPPVAAARELTKIHEEFLRGKASEVREELEGRSAVRGEFTLLVGKAARRTAVEDPVALVRALEREGLSRMDAIKAAARQLGLAKREVYAAVEKAGA
jgi:16S rRNA (cytidine1402-2'-O)-methyltransferase